MDENQRPPPPTPCEPTHEGRENGKPGSNPENVFHDCSVTPNLRVKLPVNQHTGEMGVSNSDWSDNEGVETGNFNVYKRKNRPLKKSPEEV